MTTDRWPVLIDEHQQALVQWAKVNSSPGSSWLAYCEARGGVYVERWVFGSSRGPKHVTRSTGVALLWALAVEIDEGGETPTGERVCRACGGRGEFHQWGRMEPSWQMSDATGLAIGSGRIVALAEHVTIFGRFGLTEHRWHAITNCYCDGATRPHTTALAHVVAQLASQRSPMVTDWPAQWLVDLDAMAANGWGETWLPSQGQRPASVLAERWEPLGPPRWSRGHDPTPAWQCAWWRAFWEWAHAGAEPDPAVLGPLLAERVEARRERPLAEWTAGVDIDGALYAAARVDIDWGQPEPVDYRRFHDPRVEIRVVVEGRENARALVQQHRSNIAGRGASRIRVLAGGGVTLTATAWATDVRTEYHGDTRSGVSLTGVATFSARRQDVRVAEVPGARLAVP